ncbi:hypothetical protein CCS01_30305 [Rhodopila globiformis]|uniref:Uncharacterized protein n=1 Tax=Rhodopila globiformis TaxID=1071 RepID=A0A2S6MVE3_RHOGL|nr:hypothetical protein CCS01_30305 [Rhodopila globiformis]
MGFFLTVMAGRVPTGCTHLGNKRKIRCLLDIRGRSHIVMARLVRATYSSTCAATGGPDKPGHDGEETVAADRFQDLCIP